MKVKDLKNALQGFPEDMPIFVFKKRKKYEVSGVFVSKYDSIALFLRKGEIFNKEKDDTMEKN